ncbi:MAG: helix-turn-helix transcriptional regulator [Leptolyngbyaceae cyanobacterium SU_3_3]|nr:helix-turn-helix transcriptional regulator [Leptolyngbyaceae cyanobacterium SU_3_3]
MSLDLTSEAVDEIWAEAEQQCAPVTTIDGLETIHIVPSILGQGYERAIELMPGVYLNIFYYTFHDLTIQTLENEHLVQFLVNLSGVADGGDYLLINSEQGYIGGSGIQLSHPDFFPQSQTHVGVNIHLEPQMVQQLFALPTGELPPEWQPLLQDDRPQQVFSPKTTPAIRTVVQQMIDCPLQGMTKRLYLQGKVLELMALQLAQMTVDAAAQVNAQPKPETIAQVHYAAEILRSHLDHPPSSIELAQQLGISDRTLRRSFQEVLGTTVVGYLIQQRLQRAEQLLRQGNRTVADVANWVGYAHLGNFAKAFKSQFGISPRDCLAGKLSDRRGGQ